MVKSKEELIQAISDFIGDNNDDVAIAILEDVSDTFDSLSDGEDWKSKYEANDAEWRQKYMDRFTTPAEVKEETEEEVKEEEESSDIDFDDLFEDRKGED